MRIFRSQALTQRWHTLPAEVRRFVESLRSDPIPKWAVPVPERPGRYEIPIEGHWIAWQIDDSGGERTLAVWLILEEE